MAKKAGKPQWVAHAVDGFKVGCKVSGDEHRGVRFSTALLRVPQRSGPSEKATALWAMLSAQNLSTRRSSLRHGAVHHDRSAFHAAK
jgi:hypothetical protein